MTDYSKIPDSEKEVLVRKARDCAAATETLYGNCIQSALHGIYKAFPDYGVTEDMLQASYGLAGGIGCSLLGTCGALNAAAWIISMSLGRPVTDLGGNYEKCHALIREVVEIFKKEYDGISCSEVMIHNMGAVYDWKDEEGDKLYMEHNGTHHCATAVAFTTEIVARMIVDGKLKNQKKK